MTARPRGLGISPQPVPAPQHLWWRRTDMPSGASSVSGLCAATVPGRRLGTWTLRKPWAAGTGTYCGPAMTLLGEWATEAGAPCSCSLDCSVRSVRAACARMCVRACVCVHVCVCSCEWEFLILAMYTRVVVCLPDEFCLVTTHALHPLGSPAVTEEASQASRVSFCPFPSACDSARPSPQVLALPCPAEPSMLSRTGAPAALPLSVGPDHPHLT